MQAIVDKVIRAFTGKPSAGTADRRPAADEATEFAAELLENLKRQMAMRTQLATRRQA
jgi:hypothetical protein